MEKKTLVKIILGTIGGMLFALGMCCCLLPEWNLFGFGVGLAIAGGVLLVTLLIYFLATCEWKLRTEPLNVGAIAAWTIGIVATLLMGFGMSKVMIDEPNQTDVIIGMACGIVGLLVDILIFPFYSYLKGGKKSRK